MSARHLMRFSEAVRLTPREIEVVRLLALGCSYSQIGCRLGVSAHTVTSHIKNAYRKLDVHTAAAAVMRAIELRQLGTHAASGMASAIAASYDALGEAP